MLSNLSNSSMLSNEYKFSKIPTSLSYLADGNCYRMLSILINLTFINQSSTFILSVSNLENLFNASKKIINATLSALHREGLITVECIGIAKGKHCNQITVNFENFSKYDNYTLNDFRNIGIIISTDDYHQKGYQVSYLSSPETTVTEAPKFEEKETVTVAEPESFSEPTPESYPEPAKYSDEEFGFSPFGESVVAAATATTETPPDVSVVPEPPAEKAAHVAPSNTKDVIEEFLEKAHKNGISVKCNNYSTLGAFIYENRNLLNDGNYSDKDVFRIFSYCKNNFIKMNAV